MSHYIRRLDLNAPPRLEKSLGYSGSSRWVAWHWEPEIDQLMYQDGKQVGTASTTAWQVFLGHNQTQPQLAEYQLDRVDRHWLLLDRTTRNLYVGEGKSIQNLLEQPEGLMLLASMDENPSALSSPNGATNQTLARFQPRAVHYLVNVAIIGAVVSAIAALGIATWIARKPKPQPVTAVPNAVLYNKPLSKAAPIFPNATCNSGEFSGYATTAFSSKELNVVGVYEARSDHSGSHHPTGIVNVTVERNQPMVLALSSYEPVQWQIKLAPGAKVEKIILNGYHDQSVVGVDGIPIEEYSYEGTGTSFSDFPYKWNGDRTQGVMVTQLEALTGQKMTSFQGCYGGTQFTLR